MPVIIVLQRRIWVFKVILSFLTINYYISFSK